MSKRGRLRVFDRFEPSKTALLVIDMQNFYVDHLDSAQEIVPNINRLADTFRDRGAQVIWVSMTTGRDGESLWPLYHESFHQEENAIRHRDGLTEGTAGHALWPSLSTDASDLYVSKTRFSPFSAGSSNLVELLENSGIENVVVCGVATNFCCETTVRDAMMLDYRTAIVSDGTSARHIADHLASLSVVFQNFGDVLTTDELLTSLVVDGHR